MIGVAALPRSGKDTTTAIVQTIFGDDAHVLSSSMVIEGLLKGLGVPNFTERSAKQRGFIELAKRFGNKWLLTALENEWTAGGKKTWIFNGVCMPWDAEFIQSFPQWTFLYVTAPFEIRFERAKQAALKNEATAKPDEATMTEEQFRHIHTHETARYLEAFQTIPGVSIINNSGTVRELGAQIIAAFLAKGTVTQDQLQTNHDRLEELYKKLA